MSREILVLNLAKGEDYVAYGRYSGRQQKYGNSRVQVDGMAFDSRREAQRYLELKFLEQQGEIKNLRRQVSFELIPAQRDSKGKLLERPVSYVADFVYEEKDGRQVVEDTKGMRTRDYIIKRKLMLYRHGIRVIEI